MKFQSTLRNLLSAIFRYGLLCFNVLCNLLLSLYSRFTEEKMAESSIEKPTKNSIEELTFKMKVVLAGIRKKYGSVKSVSTTEFQSALEKNPNNVLIFDVREKEEYEVSHLENSTFIDESLSADEKVSRVRRTLSERLQDDYLQKEPVTVYAYCSVGYRSSALLSNVLQHTDLSNENVKFYDISGGIFQWVNENRSVVDAAGNQTSLVHPYNAFFGKLVDKIHRYKPAKKS